MPERVVVAAEPDTSVDRLLSALSSEELRAIQTTSIRETILEFDSDDVVAILAMRSLPDGSGIDLLERVKLESPSILTAFLCEPGDTSTLNRAQEIGVDRTFLLASDTAETVAELIRDDLTARDLAVDRQRERVFSSAFLAGISALMSAPDPASSLSVLPERLVSTGSVSVAWTSRYDPETNAFQPETAAGIDPGSLKSLSAAEIGLIDDQPVWIDETDPQRVSVVFRSDDQIHGALHLYVDPPGLAGPERRLLASAGRAISRVLARTDPAGRTSADSDDGSPEVSIETRSTSTAPKMRESEYGRDPLEVYSEVVAHELRNHLDVAQSYLRMGADVEGNPDLQRVDAALSRIENVINEAEAVAGHVVRDEDRESIELLDAAERVWDRLNADTADLHLMDAVAVTAHPGMLDLLLENLFRNAVTHGGTKVTVTVGSLPNGFYVEDDGSGIPSDNREAIFDWGYPTRPDRNGVGLAIVKRIAQAHGWTVAVEEGTKGGARFTVQTEQGS